MHFHTVACGLLTFRHTGTKECMVFALYLACLLQLAELKLIGLTTPEA